ncbi:MAG: alkaline phosphatase [Muribaculaceae bacterium]|nr:alkaline phosphatase [Muribaculaceae bacterium]
MKLRKLILSAGMALAALGAGAVQPRYIFYFIGDGMGPGHVMAAQTFNRVALGNQDPLLMMQLPIGGVITTYSASSTVTDSAAAGTALATGSKTRNGMLGMNADTVAVTSIAEQLHNDGWGVGLVTTVAPDDATPGAFYAHVPARRMTYEIGRQAAESGYEFIAGSFWRGSLDKKGNPTDLIDYFRTFPDLDLVSTTDSARASQARRIILTSATPFNDSNVGFTIDSIPGALSLPDMTEACLGHLQRVSPDRFFMMVEGGNIDHVGHGNDAGTVVIETLNFDKALRHAYDFYLAHPDETLIIVTADHETGGLSVGNRHVGYQSFTPYILHQKMSKEQFSREVKQMLTATEAPSWDDFKARVTEATGLWGPVPVSEAQEQSIRDLFDATFNRRDRIADEKTLYASYNALATEVWRILNDIQGFGWTTSGHSGNPVPVYAIGAGLEELGTWGDNTSIAPLLFRLTGYSDNESKQ